MATTRKGKKSTEKFSGSSENTQKSKLSANNKKESEKSKNLEFKLSKEIQSILTGKETDITKGIAKELVVLIDNSSEIMHKAVFVMFDNKAYKKLNHKTFKDFVNSELKISYDAAYKIALASKVAKVHFGSEMIGCYSDASMLELRKYSGKKQRKIIKKLQKKFNTDKLTKGQLTAKAVKDTAEKLFPESRSEQEESTLKNKHETEAMSEVAIKISVPHKHSEKFATFLKWFKKYSKSQKKPDRALTLALSKTLKSSNFGPAQRLLAKKSE